MTGEGRKIKLIWDFRGPDSAQTAEHFRSHLDDYIARNEREDLPTGVESFGDSRHIAFLVTPESGMPPLRDALRPHRGEIAEG